MKEKMTKSVEAKEMMKGGEKEDDAGWRRGTRLRVAKRNSMIDGEGDDDEGEQRGDKEG